MRLFLAIGQAREPPTILEKVMVRITYVGAAFLAVVAIVPTIINSQFACSLYCRWVVWRYGLVDCRQRGVRFDSKDR